VAIWDDCNIISVENSLQTVHSEAHYKNWRVTSYIVWTQVSRAHIYMPMFSKSPHSPPKQPSFDRPVHCMLGLPFDAVNLSEAVARVRHAVLTREPLFISTPNLNFLIASQKDPAFRDSVIHSDLSLADGMPILWLAKLLNVPIHG